MQAGPPPSPRPDAGSPEAPPPLATKACPRCGKCQEDWASICPECQYEWPQDESSASPEDQAQAQAMAAFDATLEKEGPAPRVVWVLIGINLLVFAAMVLDGVGFFTPTSQDLFRWGANYPPATVHGQWWRLLTATFIHIGVVHLAFNLYVLWAGGLRMERILGYAGFTITYLLSGLAGSLATLVFHPSSVGAGASGAIFGIYGALLGFLARDRTSIPRPVFTAMGKSTLIFLGYNLLFSLKPGIDLSAHFGGLAAGFLCGLVLSRSTARGMPSNPIRLQAATLTVGLLAVGLLGVAIARVNREDLEERALVRDVSPLEDRIRKLLQGHFDGREDARGLEVRQVTILQHDGDRYAGTAALWWIDRQVDVSLTFQVKGDRVEWSLGAIPSGRSSR